MAKFCGKCGTKLDEHTGLCPKCNASNRQSSSGSIGEPVKEAYEKKELKKQKKNNIKKEKKAEKKKRKILPKIILFIVLFMVGAASVVGVLLYFDIIEVSDILNIIKAEQSSTEVEKNIPDTDMSGISFYESSESNIVTEDGITFVNNEILVTLESNDYKAELDSYLSEKGARIVGELTAIAEYQILFDNTYSRSEISNIKAELEAFDWVVYASLNYAMKSEPNYIPNDSKWKNKWEDVPDGGNWGMEAIDAPAAWDYADKLQTVNIGVIDDMFDINHEDLDFAEVPLGQYRIESYLEDNKRSDHGTHVAGTIAATFDNKKGVSGVSAKTNLYGVATQGLWEYDGYETLEYWEVALVYLIDSKKCSVVNISLGYDQDSFEASRGCKFSLNCIDEMSNSMEKFLKILIDRDYQFVICKSAGNQNEVGGIDKYRYYLKDTFDEENEYMYYSEKDYQKFLDGKADDECKAYFERHKEDMNIRVSDGGCLDDGNVDAKYDFFCAITDQKVKDRIIVVGAVENVGTSYEGGFLWFGRKKVHNGYKLAPYSLCGERVDVLAPGTNIQSTVPGGYAVDLGTSMAAPHVAGTAGLAFAANPDMTGAGAKEIIKNSVSGSYGKENYGIINAKKVIESAFEFVPENEENESLNEKSEVGFSGDVIEFEGHYYCVYDIEKITEWEDAKQYCEDQGGYLAMLTSEEEDEFIYTYLKGNFDYEGIYLGFMNHEEDSTWVWDDGEMRSYKDWNSDTKNDDDSDEDFVIYYYKLSDSDQNGNGFDAGEKLVFLCEWDNDPRTINSQKDEAKKTTSDERDIVLVLDTSGSMGGTPLDETKKASEKFINTILKEDASIGMVSYSSSAEQLSDFSVNRKHLTDLAKSLINEGETNIESGLKEAKYMLNGSNARKKIIVLMSDGAPNKGKEGEELITYANELKESGNVIYTLGFFENMGDEKSSAQYLMEHLASDGCHYEVASAEDLVFFFEDIADQINGQKYIYVRIACPVDVTVNYKGKTLCSAEDKLSTRTDFGTLSFEENESMTSENDRIKVLRLKEGAEYDIQIVGTGRGIMDYTIGFMNEDGEYSDFRRFENVRITKQTVIDTAASVSEESVLNIDEDGDGKYDVKLLAKENGYGEEVKIYNWYFIVALGGGIIFIFAMLIIVRVHRRKKRKVR